MKIGYNFNIFTKTGLVLSKGNEPFEPVTGKSVMEDNVYDKSVLYQGTITINGKIYIACDVYYPPISYKDVVYLPVLWRQGMKALGIDYTDFRPETLDLTVNGNNENYNKIRNVTTKGFSEYLQGYPEKPFLFFVFF